MKKPIKQTLRFIYHRIPLSNTLKQQIKQTIYGANNLSQYVLSYFKYHKPYFSLPKAQDEKADIFVFSVIDWPFRFQRPQQLATELAKKGYRVFYISCSFEISAKAGFKASKLDATLPLYEIKLCNMTPLIIYHHILNTDEINHLKKSLKTLIEWTERHKTISIVDHPFWTDLAFTLPNNNVVYDCMDHHAGFGNTGLAIEKLEERLFKKSALVLTSSQKLFENASALNSSVALVRNATNYEHFEKTPETIFHDPQRRKIIGYYGAIADWFDVELVAQAAKHFSDHLLLLIGNDTIDARSKLNQFKNVVFTGEVHYQQLPYYLHAFDVCIIPFLINSLTEATNPVKAYEYLSAGKPVVSVNLPELRELSDYVSIANTPNEFCNHIRHYLNNPGNPLSRQTFASSQTWSTRAITLENALTHLSRPLVSIVILTYNNLHLTQKCIESIEKYTGYPNLEIIIVDNASTDNTRDYLKKLTAPHYKIILNTENKGFAAGNNIGIQHSSGDYIVLLNNDTTVTQGWLSTFINHATQHPNVGLLGPVTDNIGNEAKIHFPPFLSDTQKRALIKQKTLERMGQLMPIRTLAFFCVVIPRKVLNEVGMLDEQYGLGFFEDDDYCRRVEAAGYKVFCAQDVFIFHQLSASFNQLDNQTRNALFERNKKLYEKKWGPWEGHYYKKIEDTHA